MICTTLTWICQLYLALFTIVLCCRYAAGKIAPVKEYFAAVVADLIYFDSIIFNGKRKTYNYLCH